MVDWFIQCNFEILVKCTLHFLNEIRRVWLREVRKILTVSLISWGPWNSLSIYFIIWENLEIILLLQTNFQKLIGLHYRVWFILSFRISFEVTTKNFELNKKLGITGWTLDIFFLSISSNWIWTMDSIFCRMFWTMVQIYPGETTFCCRQH